MSKTYYPTIGLEIHAELKTKSKMFCGCKNDPDEERPNTNICPVCMAHPGTLPVINKQALEYVVRVGLALGGTIADFTEFDRKNYFYPDIPKGYQISQYKYPIVSGGELNGVKVTRVHLEEDTGNNKHDRGDFSLVDFNRAGVPLMELVTEPVIHSAEEAAAFAKELQLVFWYLGVSEANMEKGEMRVEANISLSDDPNKFGTKVEVKNLNSFRSVERAIKFELERMEALYEVGKESEIVQETRGWDEAKQKTFSQRSKESAHDYRYFPDPDLPKLKLSEMFDVEELKKELPELPKAKRDRYKTEYGIKDEDIESYINDKNLADWFEEVIKELKNDKQKIQVASNFVVNDIMGVIIKNSTPISNDLLFPQTLARITEFFSEGKLSSRSAKDIINTFLLKEIPANEDVDEFISKRGLLQSSDEGALKEIVQKIIDANPKVVETYKGGKENALMSLVGQVMKETKGSANPALVQSILKTLLQ